jgi:glycosyltransferase involved in cell wall biosynthesis
VEIGSQRAPRLAEAGAPPLIAAVSRHDPHKGWDVLLGALDCLRRQGVPYRACLAGGGPQLTADRELARRLGLGGGSVEILGEVPDPFALLRRADVFVLPSRAEQSGSLSLLEALQAGCAVVASRVDGIPEDVTDGASALLVEPGDPAALAGALARLLGDSGLRRRLGTAARKVFEDRFSAAAFAAALGRVYAELGVFAEAQEPPRSDGARASGSR